MKVPLLQQTTTMLGMLIKSWPFSSCEIIACCSSCNHPRFPFSHIAFEKLPSPLLNVVVVDSKEFLWLLPHSKVFQLSSCSLVYQNKHLFFNASKCCVFQFTIRAVLPMLGTYSLDRVQLHITNSCKDLGALFALTYPGPVITILSSSRGSIRPYVLFAIPFLTYSS